MMMKGGVSDVASHFVASTHTTHPSFEKRRENTGRVSDRYCELSRGLERGLGPSLCQNNSWRQNNKTIIVLAITPPSLSSSENPLITRFFAKTTTRQGHDFAAAHVLGVVK